MALSILEKFAETVREEVGSFEMTLNTEGILRCMQLKIGNARLVYRIEATDADCVDIRLMAKLLAIVYDEKVYLVSRYDPDLSPYYLERIPEGVYYLSQLTDEQNQAVTIPVNRQLYEELDVDIQENTFIWTQARTLKLNGKTEMPVAYDTVSKLEKQDIVDWMCGFTTLEDRIRRKFHEEEGRWIYTKRENLSTQSCLDSPDLVEPYEQAIADALLTREKENNITVTFRKNGNTAAAKISAARLWDALVKRDTFSSYMFQTIKSGEQLLKTLGCNETYRSTTNRLTCQDIVSIKYGHSILYNAEDNLSEKE